jgi:hypothetical protein
MTLLGSTVGSVLTRDQSYYAAQLILVGTHIYMLRVPLKQSEMNMHSYINLVASALFMHQFFG